MNAKIVYIFIKKNKKKIKALVCVYDCVNRF